jgi:O-antigen ligase
VRFPRSLRASTEALVLGVSFPVVAVHPTYAPGLSVALGSANVTVETGDVAMVAVVVAMIAAARRLGIGPIRKAWGVLAPAGLLVSVLLLATALGPQLTAGYPLSTTAVSAAKFFEYALLALAVPLIVRTGEDAKLVIAFVVATGLAATTWGVLQIIGLVSNFDRVPAGRRMPSFTGYHDLAILSGLTLAVAIGAIALGHPRPLRSFVWLAACSGVVGMMIASALSAVLALMIGIGFAVLLMVLKRVVTRARLAALAAIAVTLLAGSALMRSGDAADFVGFLGSSSSAGSTSAGVESYSQRTVLSYIGLRIFLDHPVTGVGWQGSELFSNVAPYLGDVRRRFPDVTDKALPSAEHPWGVQNAYVQAAADMGVAGFVLIVWLALAAVVRPARATLSRGRAASLALAVTIGAIVCAFEWAALGLVAGGPATAFIWFTIGSAVAVGSREPEQRPA